MSLTYPSMASNRMVRAYLLEAKYECLRMLRSPTFAILSLAVPVLMYLFLGVYLDGTLSKAPPARVAVVFGHWCAFSVMWPGMFGFGASVAVERDQGLLALKRAQPVPFAAYLLAKSLMAILFSGIVTILMAMSCSFLAHSNLVASQYAGVVAVSMLGALPFAAIGLFVGSRVPGQHVTGTMYLVYIPLMLVAGLFFPVPQNIKLASPAYYLDQLLEKAMGAPSWGSATANAAVLLALVVVLTAISVRRLSRVG